MVHSLCWPQNIQASYIMDRICQKRYPKEYQEIVLSLTTMDSNAYFQYHR